MPALVPPSDRGKRDPRPRAPETARDQPCGRRLPGTCTLSKIFCHAVRPDNLWQTGLVPGPGSRLDPAIPLPGKFAPVLLGRGGSGPNNLKLRPEASDRGASFAGPVLQPLWDDPCGPAF